MKGIVFQEGRVGQLCWMLLRVIFPRKPVSVTLLITNLTSASKKESKVLIMESQASHVLLPVYLPRLLSPAGPLPMKSVLCVAPLDTDKCVPSAFPAFLPPYCSFCLEVCPTPSLSVHVVLSHQGSPWHGACNQVNTNQVLHPLLTGTGERRGQERWFKMVPSEWIS